MDRVRESRISVLARRGFGDPQAAEAQLSGAALGELGRDPMLLDALSRTGDPDLALGSLARLLEAAPDREALRTTLASSKPLRDRLLGVLGVSAALGDFLTRHPDAWHALEEFETGDLVPDAGWFRSIMLHAVGAEPDGGGADAPPVARLTGSAAEDALRVAYRRLLLTVTARDIVASADLPVVTADLADLAGATLEAALAVARAEEPDGAAPCRLAVIGMGKCGARELNYVSDVDVVFVGEPCPADADSGGSAAGAAAGRDDDGSALRSATRLASRMMRLCSDATGEGSIWQVDAALRPEGKAGPLVRTLASHTAYYQRWAKTWEFQALLKARPVAGDAALGAAYLAMAEPMVWHAAARENFVEDVQAMRRRVVDNAASALRRAPGSVGVDRELKLGPGGLRDVEFAVQLLQLVHGRTDESLRVRSTLDALDALARGGYVGREDAAHLSDAYIFLRTVEHRIQLFRLERTHTMPDDPAALRRIGRSMGWTSAPADELRRAWKGHALEVRRLHEKLFYRPLLTAVARLDEAGAAMSSAAGPSPRLSAEAARSRLAALGYADPAGAMANIAALTTGVSRRAAIQRTLLPVLLGWFADAPDPDAGLLNFRRLSDALGSTPWYLRSLRDEGEAAWRLATVLSSGAYAPDLLMRAPESVALLSDDRALQLRSRVVLETEMIALAQRAGDAEQAVTAIRAVRRRELFRISAADLLGLIEAEAGGGDPLDRLGRALTDLTAATLEATLHAVSIHRSGQHAGQPLPTRFTVIAMGRFGGGELGYGSDADVVFVHEPMPGADEQAASEAAFEVANELRRLLQAPAADPPLLIDADLRPEGRQGPLVRSLAAYAEYYRRWSRVWESQALLRAAPVAGDAGVAARFVELIDPIRYPAGGLSEADAREIRRLKARMEAERLPRGADRALHTKLGPGGLSDVEWAVQLLQLQYGGQVPALRTTGTRAAMRAATAAGLLAEEDRALLEAAWCQSTRMRNGIAIVRGRPGDQVPTSPRELAGIGRYLYSWDQGVPGSPGPLSPGAHEAQGAHVARGTRGYGYLGDPGGHAEQGGRRLDNEALLDVHRRATRRARAVFERLFYG